MENREEKEQPLVWAGLTTMDSLSLSHCECILMKLWGIKGKCHKWALKLGSLVSRNTAHSYSTVLSLKLRYLLSHYATCSSSSISSKKLRSPQACSSSTVSTLKIRPLISHQPAHPQQYQLWKYDLSSLTIVQYSLLVLNSIISKATASCISLSLCVHSMGLYKMFKSSTSDKILKFSNIWQFLCKREHMKRDTGLKMYSIIYLKSFRWQNIF